MLEQYLNKLQEEYMITDDDRLRCSVCGRIVNVDVAGHGPLVCCGQPMEKIGHILEAGFANTPRRSKTKKEVEKDVSAHKNILTRI
jgi:desulfoferrodoxin-like iron-binding protein